MADNNSYPTFGGWQFHPEKPRKDFKTILGTTYLALEVIILKNITSSFGTKDAAVLLLQSLTDKTIFTTISSGKVVVKQTQEIVDTKQCPCYVTPQLKQGKSSKYYPLS